MANKKDSRRKLAGISVETFKAAVFDSDDWQSIVMASTLLDNVLETAIAATFRNKLVDAEYANLFSGQGALANFSAKILTAFALGLIPEAAKDDLGIIRRIRNDAAHRFTELSFDEPSVRDRCEALKLADPLPEGFLGENSIAEESWEKIGIDTARGKFVLSFFRIFSMAAASVKKTVAEATALALAVELAKQVQLDSILRAAIKAAGVADNIPANDESEESDEATESEDGEVGDDGTP